jgi:predicted nucleic acid-binding protein
MTAYLLDTNHAVQVMSGPDALRELLEHRGQPQDRFFISITVLSELYFAATPAAVRHKTCKASTACWTISLS